MRVRHSWARVEPHLVLPGLFQAAIAFADPPKHRASSADAGISDRGAPFYNVFVDHLLIYSKYVIEKMVTPLNPLVYETLCSSNMFVEDNPHLSLVTRMRFPGLDSCVQPNCRVI